MEHLKTFESFNIDEGIVAGAKKFVTGHGSKADKQKAKADFDKELDKIKVEVNKNPESFVFNTAKLKKDAKSNNYKGKLQKQKGGRKANKTYVVYKPGKSGLEEVGSAAKGGMANAPSL